MSFHEDPLLREELIREYLLRRLDSGATEEFESHYLVCDECFEELRASKLLISALADTALRERRYQDVVLVAFNGPAQLVRQSRELKDLRERVLEQRDSKVIIDLSRVSRIDSAGLGLLMTCYSHAVRQEGMLKLLNPSAEVQNLLKATGIDAVLETFRDEREALSSFGVS